MGKAGAPKKTDIFPLVDASAEQVKGTYVAIEKQQIQ